MESLLARTASPLLFSNSHGISGVSLRSRSAALAGRCRRPRLSLTTSAAVGSLPLPSEYGYVVLTAAASAILTQWQAIERAHQNTLEGYPSFLALLAIGGLGYPVTSASFGMLWVIGRVVYSLGYFTGDPSKRLRGMFHFFGFLGLLGTCLVYGVQLTGVLSLLSGFK